MKLDNLFKSMDKQHISETVKKMCSYAQEFPNLEKSNWYVGITKNDPSVRWQQHEDTKKISCMHPKAWPGFSKKEAYEIEKRMKRRVFAIKSKDLKIIESECRKTAGKIYTVYMFVAETNTEKE